MKIDRMKWEVALMVLTAAYCLPAWPQAAPAAGQAAAQAPNETGTAPGLKPIPIDPVTRSPIAGSAPLLPKPLYPTTEREDSKFTVQYVYNFARYRYTPAVEVEAVKRATASYETPEQACVAFLSSMTSLDYDWWLSNWDKDSRQRLEADNDAHHQDSTFWRSAWQRAFTGRRITLEQRLESGPYVLIVYRVDDVRDPGASFSHLLAFRLNNNQWMATEELAADSLYLYALDGRSRISQNEILSPVQGYDPAFNDSRKGQMEFLADYPKGKDGATTVVR